MDPDTIWQAIIGQESGGSLDPNVSSTGAFGSGQIQPQTFRDYARPGERIDNPIDNIAVSKRIINDYFKRYKGDVGRIATAYFSGPGNVSATGASPFRENRNDGRKTTSSYVSDIQRRVAQMAQPDNSGFDADSAFSRFETQSEKPSVKFDADTAFSKFEKPAQAVVVQPTQPNGSRIPIPTEGMTPAQLAEYNAGIQRGRESYNPNNLPASFPIDQFHPLNAIPETVGTGVAQLGQGMQQIRSGQVASGAGNIGFGAINSVLGPLIGPLNEASRFAGSVIGNPHAADVASLALPTRGFGAAAKTALPSVRAAGGLIDLVGKENIPNVLRKLEANPNLSLMDVSEPVRTVAAGLANNPEVPAAQNIMRGAYDSRTAARKDIVQQSIDRTLGPKIDVKEYLDQLKENVKRVGAERINPAIEGAQPIGVKPLVDRLDSVIKAPGTADETINRLTKLKSQITSEAGNEGFIDPQKLHGIQYRLRAEAENLSKSASGSDRNLSGPLFNARNDMVSAIDAASGGKYKPALAGFRDESHVQDAFEKGFDIFKSGGVEDFPEFFRDWAKNAQPSEIAAAKVGALTAARRQIEGMQGGARRGENILGTTFNQEKMATLFGPQQTQQLSGLLEDARSMTDTNSLLYKNSKTAQVTAGQNYFQPREVGATSGAVQGIGAGTIGAMATALGHPEAGMVAGLLAAGKGAHMGMQYLGKLADKSTATSFAKLASSSGGPSRNELISILRAADRSGSGNKIHNLTSSLLRLAAP